MSCFRRSVLLAAGLTVLAVPLDAQDSPTEPPDTVVFGGSSSYPPFEWLDSSATPRGLVVELEELIAESGGREIVHRLTTWREALAGLKRGSVDVVPMFRSAPRSERFLFTEPFYYVDHGIFGHPETRGVTRLDSLRDTRVAVVEGSFAADTLSRTGIGVDLVPRGNILGALQAVSDGDANFAVVARPIGSRHVRDAALDLRQLGPPLWPRPYVFAVSRDRPELLSWLRLHLRTVIVDGRYADLYADWRDELEWSRTDLRETLRRFGVVIALLLLLGGAGFLWSWQLRRRVKRRTQELEESEERWTTVFELAPIGIVISETETGRLYAVNEAFESMFGQSGEKMLGRTSLELGQWDDRDRRAEIIAQVREDGAVEGEEAWYRTVEDERRRMLVSCRRLQLGGEDRLLWTVEDITELREHQQKLEETTERLRGLLDTSAGIIFRVRLPDLTMVDVSPNIGDLTGHPQERWTETPGFWREAIPDEDEERVVEALMAAVEAGDEQVEEEFRLRHADGSLHWYRSIARFEFDESGDPTGFVGIAVDVTERRRLEEQLRHQALHDPLTGVANRTLLEDRLRLALAGSRREQKPMALLMLDIDDFKRVNDSLGHTAGDRVLHEVSRRLEQTVRETDTVARWGGDEFVVVLPDLDRPSVVDNAQDRIRRAVEAPIEVGAEEVHVSVTVGGVLQTPEDVPGTVAAEAPEDLVRFADLALRQGKRRQPIGFRLFRPDEDLDGVPDLQLEQDLRRGLDAGEITVFYQPIRRIDDGSAWGVEALARWRHPDRGLVPPGEFIPLAERVGLIHRIGDEIGRQSCERLATWKREGLVPGDLRLTVNLSAHQLQNPDLVGQTSGWLEASGLAAESLVIEVTETAIMTSGGRVGDIRSLGVSFVIDDFGTGYSTYTYLRDLDIQGLKIDMSFIQALPHSASDSAIVESITTLGRRLGLQVIAEGIEEEAQLEKLRTIGCPLGQGFHLGRPAASDEMEDVLQG